MYTEKMDEARWLDEDEQRAWRSFQVMQARLNAQLARDLSTHSELSYQDYMVLVALTAQPDGRLRLTRLGHELGWEKSRISHQVTRMAERGLVQKCRSGDDGRGALVQVSPLGRERIEAAAPSHVEAVRRLFVDRLTRQQLEDLAVVAHTVLAAVVSEEQCPAGEAADAEGTCPGPETGVAAATYAALGTGPVGERAV
jgi:DNA-binding MarR family transcriptional regulator